jgi:hypothetical protein
VSRSPTVPADRSAPERTAAPPRGRGGSRGGGVWAVSRATGVSRRAIRTGTEELQTRGAAALAPGRIRRPGAGRKRTIDQDPTLGLDLEKLLEPITRGDPESACWPSRPLSPTLTPCRHETMRPTAGLLYAFLAEIAGARGCAGEVSPTTKPSFWDDKPARRHDDDSRTGDDPLPPGGTPGDPWL